MRNLFLIVFYYRFYYDILSSFFIFSITFSHNSLYFFILMIMDILNWKCHHRVHNIVIFCILYFVFRVYKDPYAAVITKYAVDRIITPAGRTIDFLLTQHTWGKKNDGEKKWVWWECVSIGVWLLAIQYCLLYIFTWLCFFLIFLILSFHTSVVILMCFYLSVCEDKSTPLNPISRSSFIPGPPSIWTHPNTRHLSVLYCKLITERYT